MNKNSGLYKGIRSVFYSIKNAPQNIKLKIDTHSIKKFKNLHKGQTCFIIGNGPSMTVKDLNSINKIGIKSFGCNKVNLIFPETDWRPDYFFVSDNRIVPQYDEKKVGLSSKITFSKKIQTHRKKRQFLRRTAI